MTQEHDERTYPVGRGKPPVHTRFKPGQSGNPRGRPRGTFDFREALIKAVAQPLDITENGTRRRRSRIEIALLQLANKAASGDLRATALLCKLLGSTVAAEPVAASPTDKAEISFGSEEDEQVLEAFVQRLKEGSS